MKLITRFLVLWVKILAWVVGGGTYLMLLGALALMGGWGIIAAGLLFYFSILFLMEKKLI